jgi:hypothetical protein
MARPNPNGLDYVEIDSIESQFDHYDLYVDKVDFLEIEPNAPVPFVGDVYKLTEELIRNFFKSDSSSGSGSDVNLSPAFSIYLLENTTITAITVANQFERISGNWIVEGSLNPNFSFEPNGDLLWNGSDIDISIFFSGSLKRGNGSGSDGYAGAVGIYRGAGLGTLIPPKALTAGTATNNSSNLRLSSGSTNFIYQIQNGDRIRGVVKSFTSVDDVEIRYAQLTGYLHI